MVQAKVSSAKLEENGRLLRQEPAISAEKVDVFYGETQAIKGVDLELPKGAITAFIGPSGCGKSTLLRCFNRMNDVIPGARVRGRIRLGGADIYGPEVDVTELRRRVGMVFQRPNPFPMSIYDNVAYGPRLAGVKRKDLGDLVEWSLKQAALWDEVKGRLHAPALSLSGGQQQRLCIARALAVQPEVLLLDEPCSALDPVSTTRIEELLHSLKGAYTLAIVTHNLQQAARVADYVAFFLAGELVEFGPVSRVFETPERPETEAYVTGRFG